MNQDHLYASLEPVGNLPNIFLVADGMGGHKAGGYASSCAVETILKEVEICPDKDAREILTRAIRRANEVIAHRAGEDERFSGMGTTVVAACLEKGELIAANVGDSRLYVIHEDSIEQVTEDHSLYDSDMNKISPKDLGNDTKLEYYDKGNIISNKYVLTKQSMSMSAVFATGKSKNADVPRSILNATVSCKKYFLDKFNYYKDPSKTYSKQIIASLKYIRMCIENG